MNRNQRYNGSLTREQFLFPETQLVAALRAKGLDDGEIIERVASENLFQYPTERMSRNIARVCLRRLDAVRSTDLASAFATSPLNEAKLANLYMIMLDNELVRAFMLTVIAEKYRNADYHFSREDVNIFFARLQQHDDHVAGWSENTVTRIKQVLVRMLIECGYLDGLKSTTLNRVYLPTDLECAIKRNGDSDILAAFHRF